VCSCSVLYICMCAVQVCCRSGVIVCRCAEHGADASCRPCCSTVDEVAGLRQDSGSLGRRQACSALLGVQWWTLVGPAPLTCPWIAGNLPGLEGATSGNEGFGGLVSSPDRPTCARVYLRTADGTHVYVHDCCEMKKGLYIALSLRCMTQPHVIMISKAAQRQHLHVCSMMAPVEHTPKHLPSLCISTNCGRCPQWTQHQNCQQLMTAARSQPTCQGPLLLHDAQPGPHPPPPPRPRLASACCC